jgi:hypothetical protein
MCESVIVTWLPRLASPPPTKRALQWLKRLPAIKALLASREMQPPAQQQHAQQRQQQHAKQIGSSSTNSVGSSSKSQIQQLHMATQEMQPREKQQRTQQQQQQR